MIAIFIPITMEALQANLTMDPYIVQKLLQIY